MSRRALHFAIPSAFALTLVGCLVPTGPASVFGPYKLTGLRTNAACERALPCAFALAYKQAGDSERVYWGTLWLNADSTYTKTIHYALYHGGVWGADTTATKRGDFWELGRSAAPAFPADSFGFYPADFEPPGEPVTVGLLIGNRLSWDDWDGATAETWKRN